MVAGKYAAYATAPTAASAASSRTAFASGERRSGARTESAPRYSTNSWAISHHSRAVTGPALAMEWTCEPILFAKSSRTAETAASPTRCLSIRTMSRSPVRPSIYGNQRRSRV